MSRIVLAAVGTVALTTAAGAHELSTIHMASGEELRAVVTDITASTVTFEHPVLGRTTVDRAEVSIDGLDNVQATDLLAGGSADMFVQDEAPPEEDPERWKWKAFLGATYVDGNSDSASVNARVDVDRETEQLRTHGHASYFYAESNKVRSDNRTTVFGRNDWLFPGSKWFVFADLGYDYDSFQSWDYRLTAHVGPGYELVRKGNYALDLRAGLGTIKEWGSMRDDWRLEGLVGFNGTWDITQKQKLEFYGNYFPDFDESGEFRTTAGLTWSVLLDEELNMSLVAGVEWEHQSDVDPGQSKNDTRAMVGLQFEW